MNTMDAREQVTFRLTAAERVAAELRGAIVAGTHPAGTPIRQEELANTYNVSRMPVREALQQLEREGLVVIYPGRGAFVNRPTPDDIREIYDIRLLLERDALQRALPNMTRGSLGHAEDLLEQMAQVEDEMEFGRLDGEFHATLYRPSGREKLLSLISNLRNQATQAYYLIAPLASFRQAAIDEHRQILQACQAKDNERALEALTRHLESSATYIAERWIQTDSEE